jgi:long-chain fatty acid transport protein
MKNIHRFALFPIAVLSMDSAWAAVYRAADPFDMGAAQASNATTEIYNPAGLTMLKDPQIVGSDIWFQQSIEYKGNVTKVPTNTTQHGEAGTTFSANLPAVFFSTPITDKLAVGFSYSVPYGSPTGPTYSENAIVGYSYTELLLNTQNYSGALAYQFADKWSFGAGLNYQQMNVDFKNVIFAGPNGNLGFNNTGSGNAWWWHAGILFVPTKATRLGFTYWSPVNQKLEGDSTLTGAINNTSDNLKMDLHIPPTYVFSVFQALSQSWGMNITIGYTPWSTLSNVVLENSAAGSITTEGVYNDTWRATLGPGFKLNAQWLFDAFVRYEQLAIDNDIRLPSQPGDANWSFGLGATYNFTDKISLKTRYIYPLFGIKDIDATTQNGKILYQGEEHRKATVLGAQLIWSF